MPDTITDEFKKEISDHTRGAAAAIIANKGCTAFGIGMVAASICRFILYDARTVRPLSFFQPELGCCLSMPAVIGRKGIIRKMPVQLDEKEQKDLDDCARNLRSVIEGAEKELQADEELRKALETDKGS